MDGVEFEKGILVIIYIGNRSEFGKGAGGGGGKGGRAERKVEQTFGRTLKPQENQK